MKNRIRVFITLFLALSLNSFSQSLVTQRKQDLKEGKVVSHAKPNLVFSFLPDLSVLEKDEIKIELPDGKIIIAAKSRKVNRKDGMFWFGKIRSNQIGEVMLTVRNSRIAGIIHFVGAVYEITPISNEKHLIFEVDPTLAPHCGAGDETMPLMPASCVRGDTVKMAPDIAANTNIDVMVVYTPASQAKWGDSALVTRIQACVDQSNQAYINSLVNIQLNLVGTALTNYTETGSSITDLSQVTSKTDGYMDEVHGQRDLLGADLVALFCENTDFSGYAWIMSSSDLGTGFEQSAFSVLNSTWSLSNMSFVHELGHNMGCDHDLANTTNLRAYPYSYGWRTSDNVYRTIMSYAPGTRILYFSSPNLTYSGYTLGVADQADNARSLNNTASIVASFRPTSSTIIPVAPSSLTFTGVTGSSMTVGWTDNSDNEAGFKVYRNTVNTKPATPAYTTVANTSFQVNTGLTPSTTYYFWVEAYNAVGPSSDISGSQATGIPAPTAPTALVFTGVTSSSITVGWTDNSGDETGFKVYRNTVNVKPATPSYTTAANAVSQVDNGLSSGIAYYYWVESYNSGGSSSYITGSQATVLVAPDAPTDLVFSSVSNRKITVGWTDNSNNESGFYIYRNTVDTKPSTPSYTTAANVVSHADNGLSVNTIYYYWVEAYNAAGSSSDISGNQLTGGGTGILKQECEIPSTFSLSSNSPNPFNSSTILKVGIPYSNKHPASDVNLSMYNMSGQTISVLHLYKLSPGFHFIPLSNRGDRGDKVASGRYVIKMEAQDFRQERVLTVYK